MSSIDQVPKHLRGMLTSMQMLYDESNFPGKIHHQRTASLDLRFSAGCMQNYTHWVPADQHLSYFSNNVLAAYDSIVVSIELDDKIIYSQPMTTQVVDFHYDFADVPDHTYKFQISVSGSFNKHSKNYKDYGFVSHMVKIHDVCIENLSIEQSLEEQGQCYFFDQPTEKNVWANYIGKPCCQEFEFTTPIYHWLLNNIKN